MPTGSDSGSVAFSAYKGTRFDHATRESQTLACTSCTGGHYIADHYQCGCRLCSHRQRSTGSSGSDDYHDAPGWSVDIVQLSESQTRSMYQDGTSRTVFIERPFDNTEEDLQPLRYFFHRSHLQQIDVLPIECINTRRTKEMDQLLPVYDLYRRFSGQAAPMISRHIAILTSFHSLSTILSAVVNSTRSPAQIANRGYIQCKRLSSP